MTRTEYLLRACYSMLREQRDAFYVTNAFQPDQTVFYDGAECDGSCLMDDIEYELGDSPDSIFEKERRTTQTQTEKATDE